MRDSNENADKEWSSVEQMLALALQEEPGEWTPRCLEADTLVKLIEQGTRLPNAEALLQHLSGCGFCRREFRGLREIMQAEPVAAPPAASPVKPVEALLQPPRQPAWGGRTRWVLPSFAFAGAIAALVFLAFIWKNQRVQNETLIQLQTQNKQLQARNAIAQEQQRALTQVQTRLEQAQQKNAAQQQEEQSLRTALAALKVELASARKTSAQTTPLPVFMLKDGLQQVSLDTQGHLHGLSALPSPLQQQIAASLQSRRVQPPLLLASLQGERGVPRGDGVRDAATFHVTSPTGTFVREDRPSFAWTAYPNASGYIVRISDTAEHSVLQSEVVTGTTWTPPQPLHRGITLQWQVTALHDKEEIAVVPEYPDPPARFRILEAKKAREMEEERQVYAGSLLTVVFSPHRRACSTMPSRRSDVCGVPILHPQLLNACSTTRARSGASPPCKRLPNCRAIPRRLLMSATCRSAHVRHVLATAAALSTASVLGMMPVTAHNAPTSQPPGQPGTAGSDAHATRIGPPLRGGRACLRAA